MTPWLFAGWKHPEGRRCDHFLRPQWTGKDHAAARATKEFALGVYIYMYIHVSHVCTCIYIYIYVYIYIYIYVYIYVNIHAKCQYIYNYIYILVYVIPPMNIWMNKYMYHMCIYIYILYICIMIILIHDSHVCVFWICNIAAKTVACQSLAPICWDGFCPYSLSWNASPFVFHTVLHSWIIVSFPM